MRSGGRGRGKVRAGAATGLGSHPGGTWFAPSGRGPDDPTGEDPQTDRTGSGGRAAPPWFRGSSKAITSGRWGGGGRRGSRPPLVGTARMRRCPRAARRIPRGWRPCPGGRFATEGGGLGPRRRSEPGAGRRHPTGIECASMSLRWWRGGRAFLTAHVPVTGPMAVPATSAPHWDPGPPLPIVRSVPKRSWGGERCGPHGNWCQEPGGASGSSDRPGGPGRDGAPSGAGVGGSRGASCGTGSPL